MKNTTKLRKIIRESIKQQFKKNPKLLKEFAVAGGVVSLNAVNSLNGRFDETEEEYETRTNKKQYKLRRNRHRLSETETTASEDILNIITSNDFIKFYNGELKDFMKGRNYDGQREDLLSTIENLFI